MVRKRTSAILYSVYLFCLIAFIPPGYAQSLQVVGWNVESGDAQTHVLVEFIEEQQGIDLWGFSEVQNQSWAEEFAEAAGDGEGANFEYVFGTTGGEDSLLIVYNNQLLELVNHFELNDINILGRVRAPLVALFKVRENNQEFLFMVNHLYRSNAEARWQQARLLNEWAQSQSLPVIAVGDYNFDWHVTNGDQNHDDGYDFLTLGDVFTWIRPEPLIKTHCGRHNSVLDFVFVSGAAQGWVSESEILQSQRSYCPDTRSKSDHRPVMANFQINGSGQGDDRARIIREINEHLQSIDEEIGAVRTLIQQLGQ